MLRTFPHEIINEARKWSLQLKDEPIKNKDNLLIILEKLINSQHLAPDDWALAQESLDPKHGCVNFFITYRDQINRQLRLHDKRYTAVPIITFSNNGERYVLLMKNQGLATIQWTAHGVRVDSIENELVSKEDWTYFKKLSQGNIPNTYLLAAAVRRVKELNIDLSPQDIANIHTIDRNSAGFAETTDYRTEYFDVDLGERNPETINKVIEAASGRYAQWTRCFKLSELKIEAKEDKASRHSVEYKLNHQGEFLPVRETTWSFIKALQVLKEVEIKPDTLTKDPWQLRSMTPLETAIRWVQQRMDSAVQFSLFIKENNFLSSAQAHAYAAKAKLNEENLAYLSLKPERLVLHVIIATLTTHIKIADSLDLENKAKILYQQFFDTYPLSSSQWEDEFKKQKSQLTSFISTRLKHSELASLSTEQNEDLKRVEELLAVTTTTELSERHKTIYHLQETNLEIAVLIRFYEKFHALTLKDIQEKVTSLISLDEKLIPLERYPLSERMCFGLTGPAASGKSVSEKMIRAQLGKKSAAYVGSDEWNRILGECLELKTSGFDMHKGNLTLPEAWFIKVLIWQQIAKMEAQNLAPNWVHETCNPWAVKPAPGSKTLVYLNTADPSAAALRVKDRGDKFGRYMSASVAAGSYRWPWINFSKMLETLPSNMIIRVIDTDIMYAKSPAEEILRQHLANIASVENGALMIHNLPHFVDFVTRGIFVNPNPKTENEVWLPKKDDLFTPIATELTKLFDPKIKLDIQVSDKPVVKETLLSQVNVILEQRKHPPVKRTWSTSKKAVFIGLPLALLACGLFSRSTAPMTTNTSNTYKP